MLISSLPQVHEEKLLKDMISHPLVDAVRYNTGMDSVFAPAKTLEKILRRASKAKKPFYVDLKGRQLRIKEWAIPPFGPIVLNNRIRVDMPAKVFFRGDDACDLAEIGGGNRIYVSPAPKFPVGKGQAVNIIAKKVEIENDFTENDENYLRAAASLGIDKFMLSFVESEDYIRNFERLAGRCGIGKFELILKIESRAGIDFVKNAPAALFKKYPLMAARDDMMIQIGAFAMTDALRAIIAKDENAICASRIFLGLEQGEVAWGDVADLELMRLMGYKRFMFSDGISRRHFKEAIVLWGKYTQER